MKLVAAVLVAFAIAVSSCTSESTEVTTTAGRSTTTSLVIPDRVSTTAAVDPGASDEATTQRITDAITALAVEVETLRGLPFIVDPGVLALEPERYLERLGARHDAVLATAAPVGKTGLYQAAGLLRFETTESILARLPVPSTPVFYDPEAFRLVVSGDVDLDDPVARAAAVHELILALTDQHHGTTATRADLVAAGADDRLRAFDALVEGDATYFELVYIQSLPVEEQVAVAAAFETTDTAIVAGIPDFIRADLAFAYDAGTTFVSDLVVGAGIAAVDQAYRRPPESSEHILHPERYRRGEAVVEVTTLDITVDGAEASPSATFGELQLDHLLSVALQAGMVTQTVDGWQGDQYQMVQAGDRFAFALTLVMSSDDDAIEVVGGLITLARDVLEAGDGAEDGGGLVWEGGSRYVFVDRVGDGLVFVLATDDALGRAVRGQVRAP